MKMKKLFIGVLFVLLILSLIGMGSGTQSMQKVNNSTVIGAGSNGWTSDPVNVTLNLENDFTVTIPADFSLVKQVVTARDENMTTIYTTPHGSDSNVQPVSVSIDVTLLEQGQSVNVSIIGENGYYDSSYSYSYYMGGSNAATGAWNLTGTQNDASVSLHYLLAKDGGHFSPYSDYVDEKLTVLLGVGSTLLKSGDSVLKASSGTKTAVLHAIVIDEPKVVTEYKSELTFVVKVDEYPYPDPANT